MQRESLVTIANLGPSQNILHLRDSIQQARQSTALEFIDIVTIEVDDLSIRNGRRLADQVQELERLCAEEILTGYGLHLKVTPYIFHTPVKKRKGDLSTVPIMLEDELASSKNCLLMLYNVCPSIHTPATFPLLSHPDEDEWKAQDEAAPTNTSRCFSRVAVDPLTCYRGLGATGESSKLDASDMERLAERSVDDASGLSEFQSNVVSEENSVESEESVHHPLVLISGIHPPQLEHNIAYALDTLCPDLQHAPRLEEKALLTALSTGTEAVVVEGNQSAKISKLTIKKQSIPDSNRTMNIFGKFMVPFSK